ncbi:uncharacterized protein K02A2.6-like [Dendronephthya gigantea]|uniref:uncharacterized protein K02A2.6-like n=1 Tax=Dendronephthya gigantea TaxID=151771 RepID=UPI00106B9AF4|nr:uncharacterized protein K02A2.6-like [Dendronephthya gigantea]
MYTVAANIKDDAQKRAVLLYVAGPSVHKIFKTLQNTGTDFKTALEKLDEYFQPQKNVIYERYVFKQTHPSPGESIDSFITRLRTLAETCEFESTDNEIRDQFVMTCSSHGFRTKLLREKDLTLAKLITLARAKELAEKQASNISGQHSSQNGDNRVNKLENREAKSGGEQGKYVPKCRNCGNDFKRGHKEVCPAKGKTCRACGKPNHFAKVCRGKKNIRNPHGKDNNKELEESVKLAQQQHLKEHNVQSPSSSDDEYTFAVSSPAKATSTKIQINGTPIEVTIDSGATTNILDSVAFSCIQKRNKHVQLEPTQTKIYAYNAVQPLPLVGKCCFAVESNRKRVITTFYVVKGKAGSLLGNETAAELGILKINVNEIRKVRQSETNTSRIQSKQTTGSQSKIESGSPRNGSRANSQNTLGKREINENINTRNIDKNTQKILDKFPELCNGIGCLTEYEQSLHVDHTVTPVAQRPRRIPFHLRKQVSNKLDELQKMDIIEPAEGPTSWVSPIVAAPKPHNSAEIRLCGDYRQPNQALLRERHPIPTVEELIEDMSGAVVFSKLDLKAGYHQIVLEKNSRNLTTFCTHKGLFRYKRLPFGLSCASEVFQNAIQQALQGLNGVRNIADDIIVWGKSQKEHDKNLEALLQRLVVKKLTLNLEKCKFNQPGLWFYGYILSKDGLSADPKKVEAIKNFKTPTDVSQLRSFLGLANYCARFIKDFSTLTAPLRELTTKSAKWCWSNVHEQAFSKVKQAIASDCTMAFYDPNRPTTLTVDASPVGLGAVLSQTQVNGQERCIAYASRSLSPVETRYSQTEKEALAAVWGCERFHLYLVGTQFDLITDHKPLEIIYSPKSKPPLRIERWLLRLQQYKFNIKYRPGSGNPADVLSRQPLFTNYKSSTIAEEYINFVQDHSIPKSLTLEEIRIATAEDPELQNVISKVKGGHWNKAERDMTSYYNQREQLALSDCEIVLRNSQIIIPKSLQARVLAIAHEGHQGIVKTKMLLRSKVWWPGIDNQVERLVKQCLPCQAAVHQSPKCQPPLNMTKLPPHPWHTVHADFCGPFPNGDKLLVVIDAHSRYPEVEIMQSTTTTAVITRLQRIFSRHGYPEEFTSDNGPPFNAAEFTNYLNEHGVHHRRITPYWPQANGEAERFMKTVTKAIRTAHSEGRRWQDELDTFLLNYRSTPHSTTHTSPAELLFNRVIRNKLPSFSSLQPSEDSDQQHVVCDKEEKRKMKMHADRRNKAKESPLKVGDYVLVKTPKDNKLSLPFQSETIQSIEIKGNMVTARNAEQMVTRNVSFFKRLINYKNPILTDDEDDSDNDYEQQVQELPIQELPPREQRYPLRQNRRPPDYFRFNR